MGLVELLLKIRAAEKVTWKGGYRPAINKLGASAAGAGDTYERAAFDAARSFEGALYVGDSKIVAEKIIHFSDVDEANTNKTAKLEQLALF